MQRICVFCGSSVGADEAHAGAARALGRVLGDQGLGLVYGGGKPGLMGTVTDAALAAGAPVIGVITEALAAAGLTHPGVTDIRVVSSMHERKALMAELADAFIALPGGYGTLDEFCEVVSWSQLGIHRKACGLLNVSGFYNSFLAFLDTATRDGFIRPEHRSLVLSDDAPGRLVDRVLETPAPLVRKYALGG